MKMGVTQMKFHLAMLLLTCSLLCVTGCLAKSNLSSTKSKSNSDVGSDWNRYSQKNIGNISGPLDELENDVIDPVGQFSIHDDTEPDKRIRSRRSNVVQGRASSRCGGQGDGNVIVQMTSAPDVNGFPREDSQKLRCGTESGLSLSHDEGIVKFRAPCCAIWCRYDIFIKTEEDKAIMLEFLDIEVTDIKMTYYDGSVSCWDSEILFPFQGLEFCGSVVPKPFKVNSNAVWFVVYPEKNRECQDHISFDMKYTMCDREEEDYQCPSQHTIVQEGDSGFITSPGLRNEEPMPSKVTCHWNISVSNSTVLQLSFEVFKLALGDAITVSTEEFIEGTITPVTVHFNKAYENEMIYGYHLTLPSNVASVSFHKSAILRVQRNRGFKMHYRAVHKDDNYIPIIDALKVNCTSRGKSLPSHMFCDLRIDCIGREDERNCSYQNEEVCPGGYIFGDSCYHFASLETPASWKKAEKLCQQRYNGNLVTPNSVQEMTFVTNLVNRNFEIKLTWYLGIHQMSLDSDPMYRRLYQGMDGTTIFRTFHQRFRENTAECVGLDYIKWTGRRLLINMPCQRIWTDIRSTRRSKKIPDMHIACESKISSPGKYPIRSSPSYDWTMKIETFQCAQSDERILVSRFCDGQSDCFDGSDEKDCSDVKDVSRRFTCKNGTPLWYSHVCDGINDCLDNSDEEFCLPVPEEDRDLAVCRNGLAVPSSSWCDAKPDCLDGSDERDCLSCNGDAILCPSLGCLPRHWAGDDSLDCPLKDYQGHWVIEPGFMPLGQLGQPPPGVVLPDGYGKATIQPLNDGELCPPTHAQCHKGYCIPIYMLCNGYKDCPEGEDELPETCHDFCKGRYKCHQSSICLHDDHVCDGWFHCPQQDDERFCSEYLKCPPGCFCSEKEVTCHSDVSIPDLGCAKQLEISNITSNNRSTLSVQNHCLISLIARNSSIRQVDLLSIVNLYKLDLSDNLLTRLEKNVFERTTGIRQLSLARNRFLEVDLELIRALEKLEILDISGNKQTRLRSFSFKGCSYLKMLHLEDMGVTEMESEAFSGLPELQVLSLKGNAILVFQPDIFSPVPQLSSLRSDNYKLCCPGIIPLSSQKGDCRAPKDEISSCEDILRTPIYRAFLWLIAILTIVGNSAVLVYKFCIESKPSARGYHTFITSLSVSDLLMGIYLVIIGAADQVYKGRYLWQDHVWKNSIYCSLAGFLSMTSSEVTAITICLVTLDRYMALAFPFSNVQITPKIARFLVLVMWVLGGVVAGVPLLPPLSYWRFYSQNGVCVPLPITRVSFPGSDYAFVIFIVVNFILFVGIAVGQMLLLRSIRLNSFKFKGKTANRRQQDIAIARKLAFVVLTDFLCWFPIGVMGILAKAGVPVPGEVNVVATIFILPLNSALNPYLYTLPAVRQTLRGRKIDFLSIPRRALGIRAGRKRRQTSECGLTGTSISMINNSSLGRNHVPKPEVCLSRLRTWLRINRISVSTVSKILAQFQRENPNVASSKSLQGAL